MNRPEPGRPELFVSRFNRGLAIALWSVAASLATAAFLVPGGPGLRALPADALFAALVWLALWRPRVEVDDHGVTLVNVSHTVTVPWGALILVETRFSLTLVTPRRRFAAWAAPAPGRLAATRASSRRPDTRSVETRTSDLPATDSGDAAALVRRRWEELVEAGRVEAGRADLTQPSVRVHTVALAALVVLLLVSVFVAA